ncbi:MAG: phosphomannomutase, partial [Alphaproteobacteria bacterium]|nr:phosphomannomutase [Alphaproteobacteria bacterium]
ATFGTTDFKVAWDVSNGSGAKVVQALSSIMPGTHYILNGKIDGTFPGHDPDPTVHKNLKQLIDFVIKENCSVGIALDGDADRVVVVDKKGRIFSGDQLLAIFAKFMVKKNPSMSVILDIKSSKVIFDYIANLGCVPLLWKTGHSNIKAKMPELKAKLAGEVSGHIFFADKYFGYDDGIYGAIRVLEIISQGGDISSDFDELPKSFITPEVRIECADDRKFDVIEEIRERLVTKKANFLDIDGLRVDTNDGWWLLRVSNTQPALVIRFESFNENGLERLHAELKEQLLLSNVQVNIS